MDRKELKKLLGKYDFYDDDEYGLTESIENMLKENGRSLGCLNDELRSDRNIVLTAVRQHGSALEFASNELKSDRDVVLEAAKSSNFAFVFANEEVTFDIYQMIKRCQN